MGNKSLQYRIGEAPKSPLRLLVSSVAAVAWLSRATGVGRAMYFILGIISTLLVLSLVHAHFEFDRCSGRDVARVRQDPHLDLSKGGRADFRGEDGALYN